MNSIRVIQYMVNHGISNHKKVCKYICRKEIDFKRKIILKSSLRRIIYSLIVAQTQLLKMPLHPGKSAPIVGADWAYDKTSENDDFEYNYNYNSYFDYYVYQNYL